MIKLESGIMTYWICFNVTDIFYIDFPKTYDANLLPA